MWTLSLAFVDIALHRRGPQDLPASQLLLGLVLAVYLVLGLAVLQLGASFGEAANVLLLDTLFYFAAIYLVLRLFDRSRRFLHTATALIGTDALLNAFALPLLLWDDALGAPPNELTTPRLLVLGLFLWSLDIGGYIFSQVLKKPYIAGVSIVLVYVLASMALREAFFPAGG